jgi:hypothetical protein
MKYLGYLIALVLAVILFWPSKPVEDPYKARYDSAMVQLTIQKHNTASQIKDLIQSNQNTREKDSLNLSAKDAKISRLEKEASKLRQPVQQMADTTPELKAYLVYSDSLSLSYRETIDTLKQAYSRQVKSFDDLVKLEVEEERIDSAMFSASSERIKQLEEMNEKLFRRNKRATRKIVAIGAIGLIGGFLIGN